MRHWISAVFFISFTSCREIQPFETTEKIVGYRLDGEITSSNGNAIEGVEVRLYFEYDFVSDIPTDTVTAYVTSATQRIEIAVTRTDFSLLRRLFVGNRPPGPLPRFVWDGNDSTGRAVPSGKYFIRYSIDNTLAKNSPVLVEGHITAVSNASGRFTILPQYIPVGERFDLYDQNNEYAGTYDIVPVIDLTLRKGSTRATYTNLQLRKDAVVTTVFILG